MNAGPVVRRLEPADADAVVALRREALAGEPLSFGASPEDDGRLAPERARASLAPDPDGAIFGAFVDGALAGIVRLHREAQRKARHRVTIYAMYVTPAARGRGLGAALLSSAIGHARTWEGVRQVHLSVTNASAAATRLYARLGFRAWGVEPRALVWEGQELDETHMVLLLE